MLSLYFAVEMFSSHLDRVMFTSQLSRSLGFRGAVPLFVNYYATIAILQAITPGFGRLAATEVEMEGEYRTEMGRLARESEEIVYAFLLSIILRTLPHDLVQVL